MSKLAKVLETLDGATTTGPYFFGETRTVLDYLLAMQAIWREIYLQSYRAYPNIRRFVDSITARPAVQRIISSHESRRNENIWPLAQA